VVLSAFGGGGGGGGGSGAVRPGSDCSGVTQVQR
jgi:hypothetical protein